MGQTISSTTTRLRDWLHEKEIELAPEDQQWMNFKEVKLHGTVAEILAQEVDGRPQYSLSDLKKLLVDSEILWVGDGFLCCQTPPVLTLEEVVWGVGYDHTLCIQLTIGADTYRYIFLELGGDAGEVTQEHQEAASSILNGILGLIARQDSGNAEAAANICLTGYHFEDVDAISGLEKGEIEHLSFQLTPSNFRVLLGQVSNGGTLCFKRCVLDAPQCTILAESIRPDVLVEFEMVGLTDGALVALMAALRERENHGLTKLDVHGYSQYDLDMFAPSILDRYTDVQALVRLNCKRHQVRQVLASSNENECVHFLLNAIQEARAQSELTIIYVLLLETKELVIDRLRLWDEGNKTRASKRLRAA